LFPNGNSDLMKFQERDLTFRLFFGETGGAVRYQP
jgi:hypothetical protein